MTHRRFTGKTAVITGAASGIGLAIARRFLAEGGRVVANDISRNG
jgi:NAD(P)-dependent dehydrogenase (short-subunit alcohol dehydrogenase family)